jgi:hypothetical protein
MIHVIRGRCQIQDDLQSNLSNAGKSYLAASSIMEYLGSNLLIRWADRSSGPRPPEAQSGICICLANYFQAVAQKFAVIKSICNSSPPEMVARLSLAVVNLCEQALNAIRETMVEAAASKGHINPLIVSEINFSRDVYMTLCYLHHARHLLSKQECGAAIAYFRLANVRVLTI